MPDENASSFDLTNPEISEMTNRAVKAASDHPLIRGASTETMLVEKDIRIPTSDGAYVVGDVFRPRTEGAYPVLVSSGPYGKDIPFELHWPYEYARAGEHSPYMTIETVNPESWVADGYAVVRVDQAGTGKTPGTVDVWSPRDTGYFYDAVEWAGEQHWSSGKVGLIGVSYYSASQFAVAARKPPHLAAIIPWEVGHDLYREMTRNGGILANAFVDFWFDHWVLSNQFGLQTATADELAAMQVDFRESIRAHEFLDDYWTARVADVSRIDVPMFTAGNWAGPSLTLRSHIEAFSEVQSPQKWLRIHTGGHIEPFYDPDARAEQKRFLDHFLQGKDNGQQDLPPIHLAIRTGPNTTWRYEQEWPLARTEWTTLSLDAKEQPALSTDAPTESGYTSFDAEADESMWQPVMSYDDVLSEGTKAERGVSQIFLSEPLTTDTEVTGPIALSLSVSCSAGDTDLFVTIRDIAPDGKEIVVDGVDNPKTPVTMGWLRLSHRDMDAPRSTLGRPVLSHASADIPAPDEIVEVQIEVGPTSWVFERGHRIGIEIGSRDLPGAFPFLHNDKDDRRTGGRVTIHTGPGTISALLLPVIASDGSS